jgi:NADH:ubiquinone oxidoreductase subunit
MEDIKYYSQCGEDEFLNTNYFKNKRDGGSQIEKEEKCREILIKNGYKFDTKV